MYLKESLLNVLEIQQNYNDAYQSITKILIIFLDNFCSFSQTHFLHCALIYMILVTQLIAIFTQTICFGIKMEIFIFTKKTVITMTCKSRKHMPVFKKYTFQIFILHCLCRVKFVTYFSLFFKVCSTKIG